MSFYWNFVYLFVNNLYYLKGISIGCDEPRGCLCFLQLRSIVLKSLLQFVPCKDIPEGTLWSRILQALQMFAWHFVTFFSLKGHQRVNCRVVPWKDTSTGPVFTEPAVSKWARWLLFKVETIPWVHCEAALLGKGHRRRLTALFTFFQSTPHTVEAEYHKHSNTLTSPLFDSYLMEYTDKQSVKNSANLLQSAGIHKTSHKMLQCYIFIHPSVYRL